MTKKRRTQPDDPDRLAQNVYNFDPTIRDRGSFNVAYDNYLGDSPQARTNTRLRENSFKELVSGNPRISKDNINKKAGGKSLKRDRGTNAKIIVKTRKEYIKQGATNTDLQGYDTIATRKESIIFARKDVITRKGKKTKVFRDAKGKFVKRTEK